MPVREFRRPMRQGIYMFMNYNGAPLKVKPERSAKHILFSDRYCPQTWLGLKG